MVSKIRWLPQAFCHHCLAPSNGHTYTNTQTYAYISTHTLPSSPLPSPHTHTTTLTYLQLSPHNPVDTPRGIPPRCPSTKGKLFIRKVIVSLLLTFLPHCTQPLAEFLIIVISKGTAGEGGRNGGRERGEGMKGEGERKG